MTCIFLDGLLQTQAVCRQLINQIVEKKTTTHATLVDPSIQQTVTTVCMTTTHWLTPTQFVEANTQSISQQLRAKFWCLTKAIEGPVL